MDVQMVVVALEVMVVPELSLFRMMIVHPPPPSASTYKRLVRMACKFTHFFLLAPSAFRFNFMFMICNLGYIPLYLLLNYLKLPYIFQSSFRYNLISGSIFVLVSISIHNNIAHNTILYFKKTSCHSSDFIYIYIYIIIAF